MSLPPTESEILAMLRSRLDTGMDVDAALRQLHYEDGLGILLLFRPFMIVCELSAIEAKRRLVRVIPYEGGED